MQHSLGLVGFLMAATGALAQDRVPPTPAQLEFFEAKIRPVLVTHCGECHSANSKPLQGGLRLDHRAGLLRGGDSGPAVVPGHADQGQLLKALRYDGLQMPPKGKLPEGVIRDFESWVAMGAPDPRDGRDEPPRPSIDLDAGRRFWVFQPVRDPIPPAVDDSAWALDPLDRFILARLQQAGLRPSAEADRNTWLRRVTWDLTGLPPNPTDVELFLGDTSPAAFETVVDRLLSSRAFGERWARHWLDLTGYADMMGTSNNVFAEHAWRYRDYLISAFQHDKPFDQFVKEQIAGDLLPASSPGQRAEQITATGFLMVGDVEIVEPDKAKMEADHIDTQVAKIGTAFLGMTLGCVRCHDHKFDPIGVPDYYGMAGILRSSPSTHKIPFGVWSILNSTELPETPDQQSARQAAEAIHAETLAALIADRGRQEAERKTVQEQLAALEAASAEPGSAPVSAEAKAALIKRRDELSGQLNRLAPAIEHAEFFRSKVPRAFAMSDGPQPADMPVFIRGNPYAPSTVVPRGAIRVASWAPFPAIPPQESGRRQLADWLVDVRNPLTPRVAVNRIWQKLFGEGLVRSVDYFGTRGEAPSHPELLDHLATRFMRQGWSQKQFIKALVLSRTYRLSSVNSAAGLATDPDNRLLWRMNRLRLDAEALRDGLLAVSGELQPGGGGPGLVLEELENCGSLVQQGVNPPHYTHRKPRPNQEFQRTIYLPVMRTSFQSHDRLRTFFDFVNPAQIAGQRNQTVVPTQSLFLMNNDMVRKRSRVLAERVIAESSVTKARLDQLWLRVYSRLATTEEREAAAEFLVSLDPLLPGDDPAVRDVLRWQELCHSLLTSNEFVFRL